MLKQLFITDNFFDRCLKIFLFCLPIIWLPGFTQVNLQMLFFNYGTLILFGLGILLPAKREFRNYNILLILSLSILISLLTNPHALSLSLLNIIFGCMLYFIIVRTIQDVKGIMKVFLWLVGLNIGVAILQVFGIDFVYKEKVICGLMAHKNHLAMFLALASPMMISYSWLFALSILILLFYIKCTSALIGFAVGILILTYFKKIKPLYKIIIYSLLAMMIVLAFIKLPEYKTSSRLPVWEIMLKESLVNPFVGKGLDSFKILASSLSTAKTDVIISYNEYLRTSFELGILPTIIILLSLFKYYKSIFIANNILCQIFLASIIAFLIMMGFQDPLHITRLAIPFLAIVACFEIVCIDNQKKEEIHYD
jgi:hypothetical protein